MPVREARVRHEGRRAGRERERDGEALRALPPVAPGMKDDAEIPNAVPRKRRQLERALDRWIAAWLASEQLTPSERRRLEAEKERRKALRRASSVELGLIVAPEGLTPAQLAHLIEFVGEARPVRLHWKHGNMPLLRKVLGGLEIGAFTEQHPDDRDVVRAATLVVAAPKESQQSSSEVWAMIRYAKHRKTPVMVVMPNGDER